MGINLTKGGRINLSKTVPSLKRVGVGLGWDANTTNTGSAVDLDASVFGLTSGQKLKDDNWFIFYNNLESPGKAVVHSGDNKTGTGAGDDEFVTVDLEKMDGTGVEELSFVVTIHEATQRKQNFGQVNKSYIRILDMDTGTELARYDLEEDFSTETALQFGSLYLKDGSWGFKAVGQGYSKGLDEFVTAYGGNLATA